MVSFICGAMAELTDENASTYSVLSQRGQKTSEWTPTSILLTVREEAGSNPYHPTENPEGIVDFGNAENKLCEDLILAKLNEPAVDKLESYMLYYTAYHGVQSFRKAIAEFLNERLHAKQKLNSENMIITSGVGAAFDYLAHVLGDPDDSFIQITPYYYRLYQDMGERSFIKPLEVHLPCRDGDVFQLSVERLEESYQKAISECKKVRGIMLINPHNPLGQVYKPKLITDILQWAKRYSLHVIFDEIYALSILNEDVDFCSVAAMEQLPDPQRTHMVWGISKDFSLSGFRVGMVHSWNPAVIAAIKPMCYLANVPSLIQHKVKCILSDKKWLDEIFFPTNRLRMQAAAKLCCDKLDGLGVRYIKPQAAFFIWTDLSEFLPENTSSGELELFKQLADAGIYAPPSTAFYSNVYGWFRILFTMPPNIVEEFFKRLENFMKKKRESKNA